MNMTNAGKHKYAVNLVSDHLNYLECDHTVHDKGSSHDIEISGSEKKIKIFCNFARSQSIKIPRDFKAKEEVLYMVVSPSDRNNIGYISSGGTKLIIDDAINSFKTENSPKNIQVSKLKFTGLKTFTTLH